MATSTRDSGTGELPAGVAAVLYRVAQESVRNAILHASPRRIRISLHRDAEMVTLQVYDDGVGFDVEAFERKASASRRGLSSVRERLALIDGALEISPRRRVEQRSSRQFRSSRRRPTWPS